MRFEPLHMQRVIRDDRTLGATEKSLLLCAVLRTDNNSRRVRASLQYLASDASLSERTARRVFAPRSTRVLQYFEKVERSARAVNLTFAHPSDVPAAATFSASTEQAVVLTGCDVVSLGREPDSVSREADAVTASFGQGDLPSPFTAPTSAFSSLQLASPAVTPSTVHEQSMEATTGDSSSGATGMTSTAEPSRGSGPRRSFEESMARRMDQAVSTETTVPRRSSGDYRRWGR